MMPKVTNAFDKYGGDREGFYRWAIRETDFTENDLRRGEDGEYLDSITRLVYVAWSKAHRTGYGEGYVVGYREARSVAFDKGYTAAHDEIHNAPAIIRLIFWGINMLHTLLWFAIGAAMALVIEWIIKGIL